MMPYRDGVELLPRSAPRTGAVTYMILLTALGGKGDTLEAVRRERRLRRQAARCRPAPRPAPRRGANPRAPAELVQLGLSQQQIVQQERLRALGKMATGIAHDFSNAMTPVVGFSDLLLMLPASWTTSRKSWRSS